MSEEYYAKLDQRIVYSSMWEEDGDTCKVWITFLALKHIKTGVVDKNPTGIARLCNLPLEKVMKAISKFESPDPNSSSKEHEGRRLLKLETGGWLVVNHERYMSLGWSDDKKAYERDRKAAYRESKEARRSHDYKQPSPASNGIASAIYEAYPRKVGKPKALASIEKAAQQFGHELLLEKTKQYAAARIGQNPDFTPHPTTFFNQHRFNDDPSTWKDAILNKQPERPQNVI
jgi:hypothetical protein